MPFLRMNDAGQKPGSNIPMSIANRFLCTVLPEQVLYPFRVCNLPAVVVAVHGFHAVTPAVVAYQHRFPRFRVKDERERMPAYVYLENVRLAHAIRQILIERNLVDAARIFFMTSPNGVGAQSFKRRIALSEEFLPVRPSRVYGIFLVVAAGYNAVDASACLQVPAETYPRGFLRHLDARGVVGQG